MLSFFFFFSNLCHTHTHTHGLLNSKKEKLWERQVTQIMARSPRTR